MERITTTPGAVPAPSRVHRVLLRLAFNALALVAAAAAFVAHEHFKLQGQARASLVSLVVAAVCVLIPVRALLRVFFGLERHVLHGFHGVGALALTGLAAGGYI